MTDDELLPNDVFKRPGPHHAYEADLARVDAMRAALEVLQVRGDAAPMAALLGYAPDEILGDPSCLYSLGGTCVADDARDIGMRNYGPLLSLAGAAVVTGQPLLPYVNPTVTPVSMFWADHAPYVPEMVAPARELLGLVPAWREIPDEDWAYVRQELAAGAQPADLLERWRRAYLAEVDDFARALSPIADREGHVILWLEAEGWL